MLYIENKPCLLGWDSSCFIIAVQFQREKKVHLDRQLGF